MKKQMIMNNNKILLYEISRIQELMTGKLILEQWTAIADEILTYAAKLTGKLSDDVELLIAKLGNAATDEDAVKILADIANKSDEMADIIIPKIMSTITDAERKTINDFKILLRDGLKNGLDESTLKASADDWVNKNVTTNFEGVKEIIKKDFFDYIDTIVRQQTPPPPKPVTKPKPKSVTDVAGQSWENITPLSADELRKLEKLYRQKGLGKSFFKAMRALWQEVIDMLKSQYELMDETLSLIKSYDTVTNAAQKTDIGKKIGDNLKLLTNKEANNFKIIDEWIEVNVLDYKLKSSIKKLKGYERAAAIFDNKAFVTWLENYKQFWERRRNLRSQMNSFLNPASWFGDNMAKWKKDGGYGYINKWKALFSGPEFGELRRWAATGQTQKWSGIEKFKEDFGFLPAIGNVTKELAWTYIRLAFVYTVADYISDLAGNAVRNWDWINKNKYIVQQINSFDEHSKGLTPDSLFFDDKSAAGWEIFIRKLGLYGWDEIKDLGLAIPGLWDEAGTALFFSNTEELSRESFEKTKKAADDAKEKTKKAIDDLTKKSKEIIDKTEEKIESFTSEKFYEKYPCYKEQLDTTYNNEGFVNGVKIVNPTKISLRGSDNLTYDATLKADKKWHFVDNENIIIVCP